MDRHEKFDKSTQTDNWVVDSFAQTDLTIRDKFAAPPRNLLMRALESLWAFVSTTNIPHRELESFEKYFPNKDMFALAIKDLRNWRHDCQLDDLCAHYVTRIKDLDGDVYCAAMYPFDLNDIVLFDFPGLLDSLKSTNVYCNSTLPRVAHEFLTRKGIFAFDVVRELKFWRSLQNGQPRNYDPSTYYVFLDSQKIPMCAMLSNSRVKAQIGITINHTCPDLVNIINSPVFSKILGTIEAFSSEDIVEKLKSRIVAISTMVYNFIRWTQNRIQLGDLIVNLTSLLAICIPVSVMTECFSRIFGTSAQSGTTSKFSDIKTILKALFLGIFALIVGKLPGKHTIDEFVNRMHKFPLAFDSISKFWQQIDPIVQCATGYIETEVLGYDSLQEGQIMEEVQKWADSVAEFSDLYKKRQIAKDKKTMIEAGRLHVTGVRLLAKCHRLHYGRENSELIRSLLATTYKISEIAIRSGADHSKPRREPLIVWFCGKSGVGKSTLTYPFICDMMKSEGPVPEDWVQKIYARAPECEFFDGDPTDWMVYDDGFQIRDSIANPSPELFEIIRLGNMFPYMFHKASIEEKGNSFADVKGIVISSNIERIMAESIHCPEAVARRIKYAYKVLLKPEYRLYYTSNGKTLYKLDKSKISQPTMDIYQFQPFDPLSGDKKGPLLTYDQVVTQCSLALAKLGDEYVDYEKWLENYRKRPFLHEPNLRAQTGASSAEENAYLADMLFDQHNVRPRGLRPEIVATLEKIQQGQTLNQRDFVNLLALFHVPLDIAVQYRRRFPDLDFERIHDTLDHAPLQAYQKKKSDEIRDQDWDAFYEELLACRFFSKVVKQDGKSVRQVLLHPDYKYVPAFRFFNWRSALKMETCRQLISRQYSFKDMLRSVKECFLHDYEILRTDPIGGAGMAIVENCRGAMIIPYVFHQALYMKFGWKMLKDESFVYRQSKAVFDDIVRCEESLNFYRQYVPYAQSGAIVEELVDEDVNYVQAKIQQYRMRLKKVAKDSWVYTCNNLPRLLLYTVGFLSTSYTLYNFFRTETDLELDSEEDGVQASAQSLDQSGSKTQPRPRVRVQNDFSSGKSAQKVTRARVQNSKPTTERSEQCTQSKVTADIAPEPADLRPQWAKAQGNATSAIDHQLYSILDSRVYANTLVMYITKRGEDNIHRRIGHVIALRGSLFLMNYHFVMVLRLYPECDVVIRQGNNVYHRCTCEELIESYVQIRERDLVVFQMVRKGIAFADLVRHIQTKGMAYSHNVQTVMLARTRLSGFAVSPNPITATDARLVTSLQSIELDLRGDVTEIVNAESWMYTGATYEGDCGALLLINNNRVPAKIVGVHNAFDAAGCIAIAVPLYRDEIEEAMSYFEPRLQYGWQEDFPLKVTSLSFSQGESFNVVRSEPGSVPTCGKTRKAKSPIHGQLLPTLTKPGFLRPIEIDGQLVDPAALARAKWGYHLPKQDQALASRVTEAVVQVFMREHKAGSDRYKYPLTLEEAIVGVPGVEGLNSINKVTSPGYPYVFQKIPGRGKTGYFGSFEFDLSLPGAQQVMRDVQQMELDILNNRRPFVVWIDTLKDARIPIEKADKGKTRIFSAGPMSYVILYRKYFLPPIAHCMWNRIDNHIAVGINATSPEWHRLALKLKSKGSHCVAGDYACFDGKAPTEGYLSALAFFKAWYMEHWQCVVENGGNVIENFAMSKEEFVEFLDKLFLEVVNHIHLMEAEVDGEKHHLFYSVCNGQPSGNPGTAFVNSAQGLWMMIRAWLKLTEGTCYGTIPMFFKHVYLIDYGDDVVLNISEEVISMFNQNTLTKAMKDLFDIDFTDEKKTGDVIPDSRKLSEVTFLKRGFVFNKEIQMYVCPMEVPILLDILNWVTVGAEDPRIVTLNNMETVAAELALVSDDVFDFWLPKIKKLYAEIAWRIDKSVYFDSRYGYLLAFRNATFKAASFD